MRFQSCRGCGASCGGGWAWPGEGKGSLQNPTLEGYDDDLIRPATMLSAWRGGSNCLRPSRHRALNRSPRTLFGYPGRLWGSLWVPLSSPWAPFWFPWIPFGSPLASLGPLLGPPGLLLGSLGHLLDAPWTPLGSRSKKRYQKYEIWPHFGVMFRSPGTPEKPLKVCNYHQF